MPLVLVPVSPAALGAGNNNDYAGIGNASFARLSANAAGSTLTGIAAATSGTVIKIVNISANNLTLSNLDGASAAANQILTGTGGNIVLAQNGTADLIYDGTTANWRVTAVH